MADPAPRLTTIGRTPVAVSAQVLTWDGGMAIEADGSPRAYAPHGLPALDALANAGHPGSWWGLLTDRHGEPVVQGPTDPAPGYYVSPTALHDHEHQLFDPQRYVDAETVPFIAVPPEALHLGVHLGDVAWVSFEGRESAAIVADVGPHGRIGEGSLALARALGIPDSARTGGVERGVLYTVFLNSSRGWPRSWADVEAQAAELANACRE